MADKKITDLQTIDAVTDTVNVPCDDTVQTYKFTAVQFYNYIVNKMTILTAMIQDRAVTPIKIARGLRSVSGNATIALGDEYILIDTSSDDLSLTLPSAASYTGNGLKFKKLGVDTNVATILGTIDGQTNLLMIEPNESLTLVSDGTAWRVAQRYIPQINGKYAPVTNGFGVTGTLNALIFYTIDQGLMHFQGKIKAGSVPTASSAFFELPSGWDLNIAKYDDFEGGSALNDFFVVGNSNRFANNDQKASRLIVDIDEHARRIYFTANAFNTSGMIPAVGTDVLGANEEMGFYGSVYVKRTE